MSSDVVQLCVPKSFMERIDREILASMGASWLKLSFDDSDELPTYVISLFREEQNEPVGIRSKHALPHQCGAITDGGAGDMWCMQMPGHKGPHKLA